MGHYIQIFIFIVIAVILFWFGYSLLFEKGFLGKFGASRKRRSSRPRGISSPGAPQICPVCNTKLKEGEVIKSTAFPSLNGKDRVMHIKGCVNCLEGTQDRYCPVCGQILGVDESLVCRMFERPPKSGRKRPHIHVLGCTHCCQSI